jgi:hypothetical protein
MSTATDAAFVSPRWRRKPVLATGFGGCERLDVRAGAHPMQTAGDRLQWENGAVRRTGCAVTVSTTIRDLIRRGQQQGATVQIEQSNKTCNFAWRRDGDGWLLLNGRRRFGRVVPDTRRPGMWRSLKSQGQISESANLSWAKNAVLVAAERELAFERRAIDPSKCQEKRGVFSTPSSLVGQNELGGP